MRYSISYELLEDDYKLNTYTTPEIEFIEDKQFKRIDYMRRHCFKNISESTLAYISDCPMKFTLNVMKEYNEECLNASFNEDVDSENASSEHDTSGVMDNRSVNSRKDSISSLSKEILNQVQPPKSNFSKKPNIIY
jgi:hypothetical protein